MHRPPIDVSYSDAAPPNSSLDTFLRVIDVLDNEGRVLTRAVSYTKVALQSLLEEMDALIVAEEPSERTWAEFGTRVMCLRATLLQSLAVVRGLEVDARALVPSPGPTVPHPLPPTPHHQPKAVESKLSASQEPSASVSIPDPPRARFSQPAGLHAFAG